MAAAGAEPVPLLRAEPDELMVREIKAAKAYLEAWRAEGDVRGDRTMKIVYWTPADRDPAPGYAERLSRTLLAVQGFYGKEMKRLGLGERSGL